MEDDKIKRAKRNQDLIERMKNGESLALIDQTKTWYQPRPIIKKDPKALDVLFKGDKPKKS